VVLIVKVDGFDVNLRFGPGVAQICISHHET
jgi:hypothetical protein